MGTEQIKECWVYMLASGYKGVLYTGITSDLHDRVESHKNNQSGFSRSNKTYSLVYFERHSDVESAAVREKQIKKWNRRWKIELIERNNPDWKDLTETR